MDHKSIRRASVSRQDIRTAAKERISNIKFGEPVTNICAGENNPMRHSYFVEYKIKSHKNRFGIIHNDHLVRITNGNKKFWDIDINVIYPGHLSKDECKKLFEPIWQAEFGG